MTSLPNSIAANVNQVGGAPSSSLDTANYLTQLASSLNNFAGPVSNAINYLLQQASLPPQAAAWGNTTMITLVNSSNIAWGCANNGAILTPARTGRIFAVASGNWSPNSSGAGNWSVSAQIWAGLGTPPAAGSSGIPSSATTPVGFAPVTQQQQTVTSELFWQTVITAGFVLGLQTNQPYWFDVFSNSSGTNAGIIEYGQILILEV